MRIVVLGIGNVLLSDEGVGVHAVATLESRYRLPESVEVVDGGTAGMELTGQLANCDKLIVVDAVKVGQPPATVVRLADDQVSAFFKTKLSPHQVGLSDLLATLLVMGEAPKQLTLIGIQPKSMELKMELSPEVAALMDNILGRVVSELAAAGVTVAEAA